MAKGRKTGGRSKGTPNKATADIKGLCQKHGPALVSGLLEIFESSESDQARIAAAKELLDRGYGKARQPIVGGDEDDSPVEVRLRAADEFTRRIAELAARAGKT